MGQSGRLGNSRSHQIIMMEMTPNRRNNHGQLNPNHLHRMIGPTLASVSSIREIRRLSLSDKHRNTLLYHKKKFLDPSFHPDSWGGRRVWKFSLEQVAAISMIIWSRIIDEPTSTARDLLSVLHCAGYDVKRTWLLNLFKTWKWSWKRPVRQNIVRISRNLTQVHFFFVIWQNKFTTSNIQYYTNFMAWIVLQDPKRIKYLDEAHFVSIELHRRRAVGPIGERTFTIVRDVLEGNERCTVTLCTSVNRDCLYGHPCWGASLYGANTGTTFAHTIFELVNSRFLKAGDILILDNAKVT